MKLDAHKAELLHALDLSLKVGVVRVHGADTDERRILSAGVADEAVDDLHLVGGGRRGKDHRAVNAVFFHTGQQIVNSPGQMAKADGGGDLLVAGAFIKAVGSEDCRKGNAGLKNVNMGVDNEHGIT